MLASEPPEFEDESAMLSWIVKHVPALRRAREEHRRQLKETAETAPANLLNEAEKNQLTAGIYIGQVTLDIDRYREARNKVMKNVEQSKTIHGKAVEKHIKNVQLAQERMQSGEIVFASPATGGMPGARGVHWLAEAVEAARANYNKLLTVLQLQPTDITVFNIVALQTRGMVSQKTLDAVRHHILMAGLPGPIMVVYPMIPSKVFSAKKNVVSGLVVSGLVFAGAA